MLKIKLAHPASKYFKKLRDKKLKDLFHDALDEICKDPCIGERKTGDFKGVYCYDLYYKSTNYEIAYVIEETNNVNEKIVVIVMAGTKENFYEQLKSYLH